MNILEKYEIFKAFKTTPDNILNEKLHFRSHPIYSAMLNIEGRQLTRNELGY